MNKRYIILPSLLLAVAVVSFLGFENSIWQTIIFLIVVCGACIGSLRIYSLIQRNMVLSTFITVKDLRDIGHMIRQTPVMASNFMCHTRELRAFFAKELLSKENNFWMMCVWDMQAEAKLMIKSFPPWEEDIWKALNDAIVDVPILRLSAAIAYHAPEFQTKENEVGTPDEAGIARVFAAYRKERGIEGLNALMDEIKARLNEKWEVNDTKQDSRDYCLEELSSAIEKHY